MAYYGSNFSDGNLGEYSYYSTPYNCNFDIVPFQDSSASYSNYEHNINDEPKFIEYDAINYISVSDTFPNQPEPKYYSSYNFLETKFLEYSPTPNQTGYFFSGGNTQYRISYSNSEVNEPNSLEFNEPEFPEYDSTPYGGGYDISQTYGKSLLPSDEICYPRSTSSGGNKEDIDIVHSNGTKQAITVEEEPPHKSDAGNDINGQNEIPLDSNRVEDQTEEFVFDDNKYPWSGYEYYGYEDEYNTNNKQVTQTPYDQCDSDAMAFCESLFGYWPCLSKKDQNCYGGQDIGDRESTRDNEWKWNGASDYLFGSGNRYGEGRGSYENVIFGYQRHCPEQGQYVQVEYDEHKHSWL